MHLLANSLKICFAIFPFPGVDLTPRHWLAIFIVLVLAAAAGVGVGVPLALRVQAGASLEERLEAARRILQEVPLIDG